jgi:hypothetical protein
MVLVDSDFFDSLIIELAEKIPADSTPTFKPNPDLGEGIASKEELAIRQKLLNYLKELYTYVDSIIANKMSIEQKKELIDKAVSAFIADAQNMVTIELTKAYKNGVNLGNDKLKSVSVKSFESDDNPLLGILIMQQKDNIEALGMDIKYKLIKQLNLANLFEFYG